MSNSNFLKLYESLPQHAKNQIFGYLEYLASKYSDLNSSIDNSSKEDLKITEEEKQVIEERLKEYYENPEEGVSIEEIKEEYNKHYGL